MPIERDTLPSSKDILGSFVQNGSISEEHARYIVAQVVGFGAEEQNVHSLHEDLASSIDDPRTIAEPGPKKRAEWLLRTLARHEQSETTLMTVFSPKPTKLDKRPSSSLNNLLH